MTPERSTPGPAVSTPGPGIRALEIGVLAPVSRLLPGLGNDFAAGLRAALVARGVEARLTLEPVGVSADGEVLQERVHRLLLQSRPDVVTGVTGAGAAPAVASLFREASVPFIVNDIGGEPLLVGDRPNPWIFWNSFDVWTSVYALGYWAARHLGSTATLAVGFHEAGYGIGQAFWHGFEHAGGGRVAATQVTHRDSADDDPTDQIRALLAHAPAVVMGLYSGREAASFVDAFRAVEAEEGAPPLLLSPFALHGPWLSAMGSAAQGIRTAATWVPGLHPDLEAAFLDEYSAEADGPPGPFGLLGYETGQMLAEALEGRGGEALRGGELRARLAQGGVRSPRGRRGVDPASGDLLNRHRLVEVAVGSDGPLLVEVEGPEGGGLPLPDRYSEDLAASRERPAKRGWLNPYLVT